VRRSMRPAPLMRSGALGNWVLCASRAQSSIWLASATLLPLPDLAHHVTDGGKCRLEARQIRDKMALEPNHFCAGPANFDEASELDRPKSESRSNSMDSKIKYEFVYWDNNKSLDDNEKKKLYKRCLAELYHHLTGIEPINKDSSEIHKAIKKHLSANNEGKDVDFVFKIVRIDPKDPTKSFVGPMKELGKFLPESRRRFLRDAIEHLEKLDPSKSTERNVLASALNEARAQGHLGDSHKASLDALSKMDMKPRDALGNSQEATGGHKGTIKYDSRDRDEKTYGNSL